MALAQLVRHTSQGVTLLEDQNHPYGVHLAFTERTGGCSKGWYESLNLGSRTGDDMAHVSENRLRVLKAMGAEQMCSRLLVPHQVHGTSVVCVRSWSEQESARIRRDIAQGCDAIICSVPDVAVMLAFADCVPLIFVARTAFAVAHSGWRGTRARIARVVLHKLCEQAHCGPQDVLVYVGPHIAAADYEVSSELIADFVTEFGDQVKMGTRNLNMYAAIRATLLEDDVAPEHICNAGVSTYSHVDRFFSYRKEHGKCGRHAACAYLEQPK